MLVLDGESKVLQVELVPDITPAPDYDAALGTFRMRKLSEIHELLFSDRFLNNLALNQEGSKIN